MGVWTIAAAIIALLMFAWVIPAYVSGTFIPEDGRWSVTPGEFTPDAMAVHKQLIQLDGQKIAYIDIGRGEPVILLHGLSVQRFGMARSSSFAG
jgi:hypothetical protein